MHLDDLWYYALPGRRLKRGRVVAKTLLGRPLLLGRDREGAVFALEDICPHRGIPLHHGRFDGREVECCYHGWRFGTDGRCTAIPSLVEGQKFNPGRVRVRRLPCREIQGNLWIFAGADEAAAAALPPPTLPGIGERPPGMATTMRFPCHLDHAVIGLMDPAHGPFVHQSWWWRSRRSIHDKAKRFAPAPLGFAMVRHAPSSNSAAYRLLGGEMTTEITFRLPGIRIEHVEAGRHVLCGLTAVTPIDGTATEVTHLIWWTQPWLTPLRPLLRPFARRFLAQDRDIVIKQQEGLRHDPKLMLINDADTQARWYYALEREWRRSRETGTPFQNPVPETTLRWRS